jgi:hypothetical protein
VVGAVQVDTVPAGLEEGLGANALALAGREAVGVGHGLGVEADVRDGTVLEARGVESASVQVADKHLEASGRSNGERSSIAVLSARSIIASTSNVVGSTALEGDKLELAITSLVVKLRLPVVAVVENLVTGGGCSSSGLRRGRGEREGSATDDSVDVGRENTRRHNRVTSELSQRSTVDSEDLSLGAHGSNQGNEGRLLKRHGDGF